jgi:hypothetical protein
MTAAELTKVYNMNFDQFERFAISKGFEFDEFDYDDSKNGISYVKGVGKQTKYLSLYDKFYSHTINVGYQTTSTTEILNIKTQFKNFGYKVANSYFMDDGTKVEEYQNTKFSFKIYTIQPDDEQNWVTYEVAFRKI